MLSRWPLLCNFYSAAFLLKHKLEWTSKSPTVSQVVFFSFIQSLQPTLAPFSYFWVSFSPLLFLIYLVSLGLINFVLSPLLNLLSCSHMLNWIKEMNSFSQKLTQSLQPRLGLLHFMSSPLLNLLTCSHKLNYQRLKVSSKAALARPSIMETTTWQKISSCPTP